MAGTLREGTKRVSYIENIPTFKALDILAAAKDTNLSAVVREATEEYLVRHDKDGELRKVAKNLFVQLPDERAERTEAVIDPETQAALAKVITKLRKS